MDLSHDSNKDFFSILGEHIHDMDTSHLRQTSFLEQISDLLTTQYVFNAMPTNSVPQSKIYHSKH